MSNIISKNNGPKSYYSNELVKQVAVISVALVIIGALGFGLFNLLSSLNIAFSGLNTLSTTASINLIAGAVIAALATLMVALSSQKSDEPSIQQKVTQVPTTKEESIPIQEESMPTPAEMKGEKEAPPTPPSPNIIEDSESYNQQKVPLATATEEKGMPVLSANEVAHLETPSSSASNTAPITSTKELEEPLNRQKVTLDSTSEGQKISLLSAKEVTQLETPPSSDKNVEGSISHNKLFSNLKTIDDLPNEILYQIFHFLLLKECFPVALVSWRFSGCIDNLKLQRAQAYGYSSPDHQGVKKYISNLFSSISSLAEAKVLSADYVIRMKKEKGDFVDTEATLRNIKESLNNQTKKKEIAKQLELALRDSMMRDRMERVYALLVLGVDPEGYLGQNRTTLLMVAIKRYFPEIVKYLIDHKVNLDIQDENQETALMFAVRGKYIKFVKSLIAHKANLTIQNSTGETALILAVRDGRLDFVILLLNAMQKSVTMSDANETLMWAAHRGHIEIVQCIMKSVLSAENDACKEALVEAATRGHLEVVKFLKEKNVDLNSKTGKGDYALTIAAKYGHYEVVKYLKENNANLDVKDQKGETALMLSISNNQGEIAEYLIQHGADLHTQDNEGYTALMYAASTVARTYNLKLLEKLLNRGVDPNLVESKFGQNALLLSSVESAAMILVELTSFLNLQDKFGRSALIYAARNGSTKLVQQLIDKRVDVDLTDSKGKTALIWAISEKRQEVTELLIGATTNTSLNSRDSDDCSALMYAALIGNAKVVQQLIDKSVDVDLTDSKGRTALMWAILKEHQEVAEILIKATTTSLNAIDLMGCSALMYAAASEQSKVVQLLLDKKADANLGNAQGRTALMRAIYEEHQEVAELLIEATITSLNAIDNKGRTALMYAAVSGQTKLVQLLLDNKADVNLGDAQGRTALMRAISKGHQEVAELLSKTTTTSLNAIDKESCLALMDTAT